MLWRGENEMEEEQKKREEEISNIKDVQSHKKHIILWTYLKIQG